MLKLLPPLLQMLLSHVPDLNILRHPYFQEKLTDPRKLLLFYSFGLLHWHLLITVIAVCARLNVANLAAAPFPFSRYAAVPSIASLPGTYKDMRVTTA